MPWIIACDNHTRTVIQFPQISPFSLTQSYPNSPEKEKVHPPQLVLIIIAQLLKERRRRLRRRLLLIRDAVHAEMVVDDVGDGLRVGGRAGPAAPDCVVHLG